VLGSQADCEDATPGRQPCTEQARLLRCVTHKHPCAFLARTHLQRLLNSQKRRVIRWLFRCCMPPHSETCQRAKRPSQKHPCKTERGHVYFTFCRACERSAVRSSTSSSPIESRTNPTSADSAERSSLPYQSRSYGISITVSTPPRLLAI
jgi:hypothetical protein